MRVINGLLLFTTLVASVSLLATLQRRSLIGRLPFFFALLVFYILRSAVLLVALKLFNQAIYLQIADLTSLLDLLLQLALAYSLVRIFTQQRPRAQPAGSRLFGSALFLFSAALLGAALLTLGVVATLPVYSPVPLDRAIVLSGFVFLLLLFVRHTPAHTPARRVLIGFAVVSVANILAQYGRTISAAHRDPRLFLVCAYANSIVWIAVLVFWIIRLHPAPPIPPDPAREPEPLSTPHPLTASR